MVNLMMHLIFLIYLKIVLGLLGQVEGSLPAIIKNLEICNRDVCLTDSSHKVMHNESVNKKIDNTSSNASMVLNENEKLINEVSTKMYSETLVNVTNPGDATLVSKEINQQTSEFFEDSKNITEAINGSNKATEVNSGYEKGISTDQYETTAKIILPTQPSSIVNEFSYFPNLRNNSICLCDMLENECDINCCCDKDCNSNHWKVFTKCSGKSYTYESDYCFKNNFIFKNNIKLNVVQSQNGLFCIVKDNLRASLKYKTKEIIKTLESFNKLMPKHFYLFLNKKFNYVFQTKRYYAGSLVWIFQHGEIKPFGIPAATIGLNCLSQVYIKFLVDQVEVCSHQSSTNKNERECKDSNIINNLRNIQVISSPHSLNKSVAFDIEKICIDKVCLEVDIYICQEQGNCISEKETNFSEVECRHTVMSIQYQIWHNGSEGIRKFEAFIWVKNMSEDFEGKFLQKTEVKFLWMTSTSNILKKSGNPGYLTGKPILASQKIFLSNSTTGKREVMEFSFDSNSFLNVLGSEGGLCFFQKRIPVNFRENGHYSCSLQLSKENFGMENCIGLQKYIFKLLLGNDISDLDGDKFFNKFVATFGNSKIENPEEWVQVLIDLSQVTTSQVNFKFGHNSLICKNIISDLFIEVAYSNVGSFSHPQAKILGVFFKFGKHRDFSFNCNMPSCENTNQYQDFKLSSTVHFVDLTEPATDVFAEPLSINVKLPHDFFYPFFSRSSISQSSTKFILVVCVFLLTLLRICNI